MNECYVAGYWYARPESKESFVHHAQGYLARLADYDDAFSKWFGTGNTIKEALSHAIGTDATSLHQEVETDCYGPGEETHSLHAWNGELFGQGLVCRLYSGGPEVFATSLALLRLPDRGPPSQRLRTLDSLSTLLRITVEVWKPEWGVATSDELRDGVKGREDPPRPFIGWLTYVSRRMAPSLPPLEGATVEVFGDGHLITLEGSQPPEVAPELLETARRIDSQLRNADLLTSTQERARGKS